jgi:nucleoside-diphosphate-sugar epimerase
MKILITGAAGFVGKVVLEEALRRGHFVIALVRRSAPTRWKGVPNLETLQLDLCRIQCSDLDGRGIDVIVHLAAATKGGEAEQHRDTVIGTENLLSAARRAGIRRIVGISSIAVLDYGSMQPLSIIDEQIAVLSGNARKGIYAAAKLHQEHFFAEFGHQGDNSCTILRPGLVYDKLRLIAAHAGVMKGPVCLLASHDGEVPTIEVHSLARAVVNAAEKQLPRCEVIHLVDDQLPDQVAYLDGLRRRGVIQRGGIVLPWRVLRALTNLLRTVLTATGLGRRVPEILSPVAFSARLTPFRYSNAKARNLLGWTPGCEFM